jgi:hypothetical protein
MRRTYKCLAMVCFSLLNLGVGSSSSRVRSPETECPAIMVECPTQLIEPDDPFKITVTVTGADPKLSLSYNWSTSAGTIVSGQGTPMITMRDPKSHCHTTTVTVTVAGLDSSCQNTASCTMVVDMAPVSRKFDEYGGITFKDEKARLDKFAAQIKQEAGASGYIVFYNGRRANDSRARRRAARDRMYLINIGGIDANRVVTVEGGERAKRTMELWIAPQGAPAPPLFMVSPAPCP